MVRRVNLAGYVTHPFYRLSANPAVERSSRPLASGWRHIAYLHQAFNTNSSLQPKRDRQLRPSLYSHLRVPTGPHIYYRYRANASKIALDRVQNPRRPENLEPIIRSTTIRRASDVAGPGVWARGGQSDTERGPFGPNIRR